MVDEGDSTATPEGAALRARAQKRRERLLRGQNERLSRIQGCPGVPPTASDSPFNEQFRGEGQSGFSFIDSSVPLESATAPPLSASSPGPSPFSRSTRFTASSSAHIPIVGFIAGALLRLGCRTEWWSHFTRGGGGDVEAPRLNLLGVPLWTWCLPASSVMTMHTLCTILFCTLRLKHAASVSRGFPVQADRPGHGCFSQAVLQRLCTLEVVLPLFHLFYTVVLSQLSRTAFTTLIALAVVAAGYKVRRLAGETSAFWAPTTDPASAPSFWAQCVAFGLAYYGHALAAYRGAKEYSADHALFSVAIAGGVTMAWMVGGMAAN